MVGAEVELEEPKPEKPITAKITEMPAAGSPTKASFTAPAETVEEKVDAGAVADAAPPVVKAQTVEIDGVKIKKVQ